MARPIVAAYRFLNGIVAQALTTAAFVLLFASSACESDSTDQLLRPEIDANGFSCDLGLVGGHCAMRCTRTVTAGASYCDHNSWFQSFDQCKRAAVRTRNAARVDLRGVTASRMPPAHAVPEDSRA
jgi:hypothetical protein